MKSKPGIIIMGKTPPPFIGPALATKILLESDLNENFNLTHVETKLNHKLSDFGKIHLSKLFTLFKILRNLFGACRKKTNKIVLIPIAQTTGALYKDALFIIIARIFRKKVILQLRGSNLLNWYKSCNRFNKWFFKHIFRKAQATIVLGENLRYLFSDFFAPENIHVIPNGGDYPDRTSPISDSETLRLLYFSNFLHGKGFDLILEALALLPNNITNQIEFNAVGAWDDDQFKDHCEKLVLDRNVDVKFHNPSNGNEKWSFFEQADAFIFTPRSPEGHPWALIEAFAFSLPVISCKQGAIPEMIKDKKNGFLLDKLEAKQIAERIKNLVEDPQLRKRMAYNAKESYLAHYTKKQMTAKFQSVFNLYLH